MQAETIARPASAWLLARLAAKNAARLVLARRRSPAASHEEYEARWAGILAEKPWLRAPTLEAFLFPRHGGDMTALIDGALVRIRAEDYLRYRHGQILAALERHVPAGAELVELGSGIGGNLCGLAYNGAPWRLIGCELTRSGVAAGRAIAARYRLPIDFHRLDLLDAGAPALELLRDRAAFTYYCLEQLPHDCERAIANILVGGPRVVVHFEPAYELLRPWRPLELVSWLYIRSRDYQRGLLATLRKLERAGRLEILEVDALRYAPSAQNFPMLVAWRPR